MKKIWWEQVSGARSFFDIVFGATTRDESIVLISEGGMPWRDFFFDKLTEDFQQISAFKSVEELSDISNPGEFLLKEYCKPEKQATYRPGKGYANFLADSDDIVLHDKLFQVTLSDDSLLQDWITFVSEYVQRRETGKAKATFLIECITNKSVKGKKGVTVISYDDKIGNYDRFICCMLAASLISETDRMKKYLSELISNVIGNNIEMCERIIKDYKEFLDDPYAFVITVQEKEPSLVFSKTREEVEDDIKVSQIRVVYPALEEYRKRFVSKHRSDIRKNLPMRSKDGQTYSVPEDVELGALVYLVGCEKLFLPTHEYDELVLYKAARNDLSHLKSLDIDVVRKILK